MSSWRPKSCKDCGATAVKISTRGLCVECAIDRQTRVSTQIATRQGPKYDNWKAAMRDVGQRLG